MRDGRFRLSGEAQFRTKAASAETDETHPGPDPKARVRPLHPLTHLYASLYPQKRILKYATPIQGRFMKKLAILTLLALACWVSSCGTTSTVPPPTSTSASGNWEAQLTGGTGPASQLNFVIAFAVTDTNGGSSQPLSISGFSFFNNSSSSCFQTPPTVSGSATLSTSNTNQVSGTMTITVVSAAPAGNVLTLNGTTVTGTASSGKLSNGAVSGTFTLQGVGSCSLPTGTATSFTLCQNATTCSTTT